ncbi:MAG: hypothetical protein ACK45V_13500, partial [Brevundimonas sp.]
MGLKPGTIPPLQPDTVGPLSARDAPRASARTPPMTLPAPKKVVLAYSGGLDTSIILKWLQT